MVVRWVLEQMLKTVQVGSLDSIKIACFESNDEQFYQFIKRVLALVEEVDVRRYRRITRELSWIVNRRALARDSGEYSKTLRMCSVGYGNTGQISDDDVVYFSSVVVNVATHGYLARRGIESSKDKRESIERLCVAEENRFLRRVRKRFPEIADKYISEFDPTLRESNQEVSRWKKRYHQLRRVLLS